MPLKDDEVIALVPELAPSSYTVARPRGMRSLRGEDLLSLAQTRFGAGITTNELDEAMSRIGARTAELTSTRDILASVFRGCKRWRRAYLVPGQLFEGLTVPSPLRPQPPPGTA